MMKNLHLLAVGTSLLLGSTAASAGEITGNGKPLDVNGNSSCAFSGLNDTPDGDLATLDPGGRVQTYGYFMSQTWLGPFLDPQVNDPREESLIPGWACNPHKTEPFIP